MILVVGAGFAGSVAARELADAGYNVHLIESRSHIAGNAFDELDQHGVLVHNYGPHIFHTNSERIFSYLSRFTTWNLYEHKVLSCVDGVLYPFPINRTTVNLLYKTALSEEGMEEFYRSVRENRTPIRNSEDLIVSSVGRDLFSKFFLNYTRKQWGLEPRELKSGVASRIPVRSNADDRYFMDTYQGIPINGYTRMFENILDHDNIYVQTNTEYKDIENPYRYYEYVVYTGRIDAFFDYRYGRLPYRSLDFVHEHYSNVEFSQTVGTVNYPNDHAYTRITEFKHLTGQKHSGTSVVFEYPKDCGVDDDPYYPVPTIKAEALYSKYKTLSSSVPNVAFVGRLAQYKYYNMDQVVAASLAACNNIIQSMRCIK